MTRIALQVTVGEQEIVDASHDLEMLLDLEGEAYDLSPAFRRVLFELEDAFADGLARAGTACVRSRQLRQPVDLQSTGARATGTG